MNNFLKTKIKLAFEDVGTTISERDIQDIPQALYESIQAIMDAAIDKFPEKKEIIIKYYEFVLSDIKNIHSF